MLIRNGASDAIAVPDYRALARRAPLMVRNVTSLVAMAVSGLGVTLLPALATARLSSDVAACDLADTSAVREVGVIERKGVSRSPVAAAFLALLHRESPALARALDLDAPQSQGRG